jgi:hypothetical protein
VEGAVRRARELDDADLRGQVAEAQGVRAAALPGAPAEPAAGECREGNGAGDP